ncbi:hypothetical protein CDAR_36411 [Caerostris darwini]|uniref:Uncharacterized protein n=1 Tax=Caerostris darwini TaxID=1538125 RepID=A0AAV4SNP2_9ARAC|nr:hypothetical protein CDAR_36411 [Caerostris darwini]
MNEDMLKGSHVSVCASGGFEDGADAFMCTWRKWVDKDKETNTPRLIFLTKNFHSTGLMNEDMLRASNVSVCASGVFEDGADAFMCTWRKWVDKDKETGNWFLEKLNIKTPKHSSLIFDIL